MFNSLISAVIAFVVGTGSTATKVYEAPVKIPTPTPIVSVLPSPTPQVTKTQNSTTTTKSIPKVTKTPTKKAETSKTTIKPTPTPTPSKQNDTLPVINFPQVDFAKVNDAARVAIVNILCTTNGNSLSPISGTGVMISQDGVIITNAHIGQYFLLKDFKGKNTVECKIRTGSPAYPTYNAELMYISPTWIKNNSTILKQQNPTGTGENDFALVHITERIDGSPLPKGFEFIMPDTREYVQKKEPVILISYPAGFLGGLSILQNLNVTSSVTDVHDYYTFKQNTIDLIDVGGTILSQKGSSGGAVIDSFISLLGIITTSSEANTTDKRELRAITLAHVNRTLYEEIGIDLDTLLKQNPTEFSRTFSSTTAPTLTKVLTDMLTN